MDIRKECNGASITLALTGRLDTTTAQKLQDELIPAFETATQIRLDLSALEYVSSAGLRVLLLGEKTAQAKNAVMTLTSVPPEVMEVLEMTGFDDILTIA